MKGAWGTLKSVPSTYCEENDTIINLIVSFKAYMYLEYNEAVKEFSILIKFSDGAHRVRSSLGYGQQATDVGST